MASVINYPNLVTSGTIESGAQPYSWLNAYAAQYDPAVVQDTDFASVEMHYNNSTQLNGVSQPLLAQQFGFSIPNGSTIQGYEVGIHAWTDSAGIGKLQNINLYKNDAGGYDGNAPKSYAYMQGVLTTTPTLLVAGGPSDLWGTSWTASDINGSQFGFAPQFSQYDPESEASGYVYVDYMTMKVYYTAAVGPPIKAISSIFYNM